MQPRCGPSRKTFTDSWTSSTAPTASIRDAERRSEARQEEEPGRPDADEEEPVSATEEDVARALRAAVFGLLLLPLQLYSLWLLARIAISDATLSGDQRRRMLIAAMLDVPVIGVSLYVLWVAFAG